MGNNGKHREIILFLCMIINFCINHYRITFEFFKFRKENQRRRQVRVTFGGRLNGESCGSFGMRAL